MSSEQSRINSTTSDLAVNLHDSVFRGKSYAQEARDRHVFPKVDGRICYSIDLVCVIKNVPVRFFSTLQAGTTATLQAHAAGSYGASSHAAAGYLTTGTPAAPQHFSQAASVAATPAVRTAMTGAAEAAAPASGGGGSTTTTQVAQVVRRVAFSIEGGESVATNAYPGMNAGGPGKAI